MKKIAVLTWSLAAMLFLLLLGCQKSPELLETKSALTLVMDNSSENLTKAAKTIQFDSGYVYVTKVEVHGELENDHSDSHENDADTDHDTDHDGDKDSNEHMDTDNDTYFNNTVEINTRINLATGAYEIPIEFDLLNTNYDDIKFKVYLNSTNSYPAIEVYGTYINSDNQSIPVAFIYNDSIMIKTELDQDDDQYDEDLLINDTVPAFVIHLFPAKWFSDVSADMLDSATLYDGVILINDTANTEIYNKIIDKIGKQCRLEVESRERWEHQYHSENH